MNLALTVTKSRLCKTFRQQSQSVILVLVTISCNTTFSRRWLEWVEPGGPVENWHLCTSPETVSIGTSNQCTKRPNWNVRIVTKYQSFLYNADALAPLPFCRGLPRQAVRCEVLRHIGSPQTLSEQSRIRRRKAGTEIASDREQR